MPPALKRDALTGRSRHRAMSLTGTVYLVLQVETETDDVGRGGVDTVRTWRDATVADLTTRGELPKA